MPPARPRLALSAVLASGTLLALVASLALSGCRPDPQKAEGQPGPLTHTYTTPWGETLQLPVRPRRIVPSNAGAVDLVLALVGPDRVAAIPRVSLPYSLEAQEAGEWPEERLLGSFGSEEVLGLDPDLVVTHAWQDQATTITLRDLGIPVLTLPEILEVADIEESLRALGQALGEPEAAEALVLEVGERAAALGEPPLADQKRILQYSNFGSGATSAGRRTPSDLVFRLAGFENALERDGYAAIENERLLVLDPDWILVGVSAEDPERSTSEGVLRGEPALAGLTALVRPGRILRLHPAHYAAHSHRMLDAAEALARLARAAE